MAAYDLDLHAWAHEQAAALRRRSANEIDWENVAEEIESLGKQQRAELRNRLELLMMHLLKWAYQPERRGKSWLSTIRDQRRKISRHIHDNPSLKADFAALSKDAYEDARAAAADETEIAIAIFPVTPPFAIADVLAEDWLPEAADAASVEESPS